MKNMLPCPRCFVLTVLFVLLFAGCAGRTAVKPMMSLPTTLSVVPSRTVLGPGDVIDIKFAYASQFDVSQTVRPDGKIVLQLIGPVAVQGKTPDELQEEIEGLYAGFLQHPQLVVLVQSFHEQRVYVGGEVNKPGLIEMPSTMTVLEAIMYAGGFNLENAEMQNVMIIRQKEGRYTGYALNFRDTLGGSDAQAFTLEPRDIIYVPKTRITDVDQWLAQYIYKLLPPLSVGVSTYLNN